MKYSTLHGLVAAFATTVVLSSHGAPARASEPGVTATEIRIGNTAPYSGPASAYGAIAKSASAYFDKVNDEGGIHGRKVKVISLDDGFSPAKSMEQTRKLVESDDVFAIMTPVGTPTSAATQPWLNARKVPQIFVASGSSRWNQPDKYPWTIGWNIDYLREGRIYGKYIQSSIKDPKIGVLYQNDDYGKELLQGLREGLGDKASAVVAAIPYELSDATVDSQIARLRSAGVNVFVSATTPKFAAQSIRAIDAMGWKPVFILPSVANSVDPVLKGAGLDKAKGIISSAFIKEPSDPRWKDDPEFKAWSAFMDKYYPTGARNDVANAYGYGAAHALHQALLKAGPDLTRAELMKTLQQTSGQRVPMFLPGIEITITPKNHGPISSLQMVRFDGATWEPFGELISTE